MDYLEQALDWCIQKVGSVLVTLIFVYIGFRLIKVIQKFLKKSLQKAGIEPGVITFLSSFVNIALKIVILLSAAAGLGFKVTSVLTLLGSAGVAIGLALQGSLSNLAGGVLILVLKPFRVGDYIIEDNKGKEGTVTAIDIFYTKLLTSDNRVVVIPNGTLSNTSLTNVSKEAKRRLDLTMSVDYEQDIKEAKRVIYEVLAGNEKVLEKEPISIFLQSFDASAIVMGIRFWVKTEDYWDVKWELQEKFKEAFDENGIAIPYNHMDVTVLAKEPEGTQKEKTL
ncbi:MAG: mechanosensitive ion channel [Lachnospiraceae bacterium]|nr:mechanosensitive ion channel [Lachnospiraceae bacterium]